MHNLFLQTGMNIEQFIQGGTVPTAKIMWKSLFMGNKQLYQRVPYIHKLIQPKVKYSS